jgi:Zn-dependent M28 family amino/carboxypeptidase
MDAHMEADVDSGDVIGELLGRELPDEVIVMGGHLDSWEVGQGAQDDGAGMLAPYQALVLIKKLGLRPRRTIRAAFWVNEENGGRGGNAYRDWVGDKVKDHFAAIEMDGGSEAPRGFGFSPPGGRVGGRAGGRASSATAVFPEGAAASMALVQQIGKLLDRINAGNISAGGGGSDIAPLLNQGVPGFGLQTQGGHYMDWHHSWADTLDKVNPDDFLKNIAALAVLSYVLADMPMKLTVPATAK